MRLPLFAYVEPCKVPYEAEIPNTLAAEQQAVKESRIDFRGGVIQRCVGPLLAWCGHSAPRWDMDATRKVSGAAAHSGRGSQGRIPRVFCTKSCLARLANEVQE